MRQAGREMCSGSEAGSYLRRIDSCGKHLEVIPVRLLEALRLRELGPRVVDVLQVPGLVFSVWCLVFGV